jgi:hypothetical protein
VHANGLIDRLKAIANGTKANESFGHRVFQTWQRGRFVDNAGGEQDPWRI